MQELKIEYISLNKIKPYNKNPRKYPKASIDAIMESIKDFEMCDPIAVWGKDNTIVEGHMRVLLGGLKRTLRLTAIHSRKHTNKGVVVNGK